MKKVIFAGAKSSFSKLLILVTMFISFIGANVPVHAQDAAALEEVVVSAQRREQNLQDVPISISAFNAESVEAYMFEDVTDYIIRTPNASWASTGAKSRREISIRGTTNFLNVNSTMRSTTFAFYVDDFSIMGSSGNPPMMDIERIEILRGPQATYFGRNALGGGISITTKKPHDEFEAGISLDFSRFSTKDIEATLNLPGNEMVAIRTSIKYSDTDGNIKNIHPIGGGNDSTYKYAKTRILFTPNDSLSIDITGSVASERAGMREGVPSGELSFFASRLYPGGAVEDGVGFWPQNTDKVNFDYPQNVGTRWRMLTGRLDYEFNDMLLTSITGYIESDFYLNGDVDGSSTNEWNEFRNIERDSFSQEFRLQNTDDDARLNWNVGILYAEDNGHFVSSTFTGPDNAFGLPGGILIGGGDDEDQIEGWAIFGQFDYDLTADLSISLGGRYSEETRTVAENFTDTSGAVTSIGVEEDFTVFTPRIAANYSVNDDVNLYATISKGFKSGGLTRFLDVGVPYEPEEMWNYEVGVKADLMDNRLRLSAAAFYMDWSDMQVEFLVPAVGEGLGGSVVSNADSASSRGFELTVTALPVSNLEINFSAGYLDAELDKATIFIRDNVCNHRPPSTECNHNFDGRTTPLSPEWTLSADAEYRFDVGGNDGFARLEWSYRDEVDRTLVEGLLHDDAVPWKVPSYDFFNLRVGIRNEKWALTAYVENLLDEDYYANAYVKAWHGGVAVEPSFQTYGVRLKYNFGE